MNVFQLVGQLSLAGSDKVRQEIEGVEGQLQKASTSLKIIGAAFTAVGVAGLKFASDARNINATLGSTAITLGITTKELRNLTLATTNVTFPIKSVAATFDILTRAGVRNTEELQKAANAFDALADATGSSAEVVADILIPALKAMGEKIPQNSRDLDKFTWLTKNTTTELSEFGSVMNYVAMYGENLNVSLDDMIAIMAVLESKGKGGATATRLFRTAVTQAKDGTVTLNEALGITAEEIEKYRGKMTEATGLTDKHAEALNKQFGFMEKVKQKFSELTLVAGSFLTPLEPILAAMTALGPVLLFASSAMGAHTIALVAHKVATIASTVAQWALNAAMTANPIGILIVAIGALITAGVLLWKNWDVISAKAIEIWGGIKDFFINLWESIVGIFKEHWDMILAVIFPAVGIPILIARHWEEIKEFLKSLNPWEWIKKGWENLRNGIKETLDNIFGHSIIENWVDGLDTYLANYDLSTAGKELFASFGDGIKSGLDNAVSLTQRAVATISGIITGYSGGGARGREFGGLAGFEEAGGGALYAHPSEFSSAENAADYVRYMGSEAKGAYAAAYESFWGSKLPGYQHGGPILGDTLLTRLSDMKPYAVAHAGERVTPSGQTANIIVMLDGKTIARAIGQPLVDEIRVKTGVKI